MVVMIVAVVVRMIVAMVVIVMMMIVPMRMIVAVAMLEDRLHSGSDRHLRRRLRVELLPEQQHQRRPSQREEGNEPDVV
jgi:hypothetical protein